MAAIEADSDNKGLQQCNGVPLPGDKEVGMFPQLGGEQFKTSFPSSPETPCSPISFPCPRSPVEANTQSGRGRVLQISPPRRGRGLMIVSTGRGRDLRPISPP